MPDAVAPPPRHPRFALVDGVRALAVLAVVVVHAAVAGKGTGPSLAGRLLAHLNLGVTIFFLISGFLLYRPFINHRTGGAQAPKVLDYAKRRILRIYPAYWVIVTILLIVPGVTVIVDGHWWPMYALLHTLPVFSGRRCVDLPQSCGLAQTWSLVVEVTFYAVLPVFAIGMAWITQRLSIRGWMWAQLLVLAALSCISVALQLGLLKPEPSWLANSVGAYMYWFALGMAMAVASVRLAHTTWRPWWIRGLRAYPLAAWLMALAGYALLCLDLPPTPFLFLQSQQVAVHLAFGAIAFLLLAPAVFADRSGGLPHRVLAHPLMVWLGLISYGVFLWHYVFTLHTGWLNWVGPSFPALLLVTLAFSIPCAAASYYLVERPILRLKYRRLGDIKRRRAA